MYTLTVLIPGSLVSEYNSVNTVWLDELFAEPFALAFRYGVPGSDASIVKILNAIDDENDVVCILQIDKVFFTGYLNIRVLETLQRSSHYLIDHESHTLRVSGDRTCSSWKQFTHGTRFKADKLIELIHLKVKRFKEKRFLAGAEANPGGRVLGFTVSGERAYLLSPSALLNDFDRRRCKSSRRPDALGLHPRAFATINSHISKRNCELVVGFAAATLSSATEVSDVISTCFGRCVNAKLAYSQASLPLIVEGTTVASGRRAPDIRLTVRPCEDTAKKRLGQFRRRELFGGRPSDGRTKDVIHIERVQRAATKIVAGLKSVDYKARLAVLDLFPLEYFRLRGDLILTYALFERGLANRFFTVDPANT
ncbi:pol-related protein [Clonorchis sinensis]|uniref:Pol-related protein n=1 Tax=Clonorchis sinensis TaxID=79923 RepID=G7YQ12_CLOSI|nr:pol-related protein [Clonorchis sinensis]